MATRKKALHKSLSLHRLRERAEALLRQSPQHFAETPARKASKLLHELRVYQAELEMQNDELRRIQRDLEDSRDRFALLYDQAPVGYLTLDPHGVVVEANLTAARLSGLDRHAFLKKRLSRFIASDSQDEFYLHLQHVFGTGLKQVCELQMRPTTAAAFTGRLESIALPTEQGRPAHCLTALSDITRHRQAEAALADFFGESPLSLLWVGADGRILRVNRAHLELLDRADHEVLGHNIAEFHADPEQAADMLVRLAKKETIRNRRARFRTRDGSIVHVLIDANGLWDEGRLVHTRWFVRDITRRLQLEREILKIGEREQQRLGQELHDDLCQHLSSIEFLAHSLAMDLSSKSEVEARRAAEIAKLLRETNTRTRELSHGLAPMPLAGEGLVGALEELARRTSAVFHRDCRFHCPHPVQIDDPEVRQHLYRIAQEAVGNAVKHGKATRIDIELGRCDNRLVLGIRDNGLGLPRRPKGRKGMGLRIMQYRAEVISGSLVVQREPGSGTSVVCSVPIPLHPQKGRKK